MLVVAEFGRRLLQLFEQLLTVFALDFCWPSWSRSVVRCLLDRFFLEPIEPVANRFLYNTVAVSQCIQLIALFAPDRRENTFSRLPFIDLVLEIVEMYPATFGSVAEEYFETARSYSRGIPAPLLDIYIIYRIMIFSHRCHPFDRTLLNGPPSLFPAFKPFAMVRR